jgi:hypothetical protein
MQFHLFMHALGEALDGDDRLASRALGGVDAGDHGLTIYKDRAGTALGFLASNLCARQAQSQAEKRRKSFTRFGFESILFAIHQKVYV